MDSPITNSHPLSCRAIGFVDHLRTNGFRLGTTQAQVTLKILADTAGDPKVDFDRLKALLTGCKQDWDNFDDLFETYWIGKGKIRERLEKSGTSKGISSNLPKTWQNHFDENKGNEKTPQFDSSNDNSSGDKTSGQLIAADRKAFEKIDLRQFVDPIEIAAAEALALKLARAIRYRLSRRYYDSKNAKRLDLRRTIRQSMRYGGTPINLCFKATLEQPVRLVVFLDVSGSMKHYSRFFLQFVKGLVSQWAQTDAFIFHTRLIRITDTMREKNSMRAMAKLSLMADGFGGGTKLGECLELFNRQYAKKSLNGRSVVMIFSDGYEVGTPENLYLQLEMLKKRAKRLVWLNPLLGWHYYQPVTAAMKAAMPLIDHFAVANTLESLAAIEADLARL